MPVYRCMVRDCTCRRMEVSGRMLLAHYLKSHTPMELGAIASRYGLVQDPIDTGYAFLLRIVRVSMVRLS